MKDANFFTFHGQLILTLCMPQQCFPAGGAAPAFLLHAFGGVYLDPDVECLHPLDRVSELHTLFLQVSPGLARAHGFPSPAALTGVDQEYPLEIVAPLVPANNAVRTAELPAAADL